jgi:hypothetical protein
MESLWRGSETRNYEFALLFFMLRFGDSTCYVILVEESKSTLPIDLEPDISLRD